MFPADFCRYYSVSVFVIGVAAGNKLSVTTLRTLDIFAMKHCKHL